MTLQFIPYIMLNGNANEAIAFYEKHWMLKSYQSKHLDRHPRVS